MPAPQPLLAASHVARQKHEAPSPPAPAEARRTEGDQALAMEYRAALLRAANGGQDIKISVAPASTFGLFWAQLQSAFQSPEVLQWIRKKGIAPQSITLNPQFGQISFTQKHALDPTHTLHTVSQDDKEWAAISGPILQAARVICAGRPDTPFTPPATILDEPVPWTLVGQFYNESLGLTAPAMRARAAQITPAQGFNPLDPITSAGLIESRSDSALQDHKALLGDIFNRYQIVTELRHLAASVENGSVLVERIEDELKSRLVDLSSDSTYQSPSKGKWKQAPLLQLLRDHDCDIPTSHEQLVNLATSLATPQSKAPANGNLGGALAWPEPLAQDNLEQLRADIRAGKIGTITLSPFGTVLDYLLNNRPISTEEQGNPRRLIDTLIHSPRGVALGNALQAAFEARGVKGSPADWLLAALNVESGPDAGKSTNTSPGYIEGYRLVSADTLGHSPSAIIKALEDQLVTNGSASSPQKAKIRAHLLLASRAPEFLVKDIPDQVRVGAHNWVSFTTAVARIEATAPGATAGMSYAQIMLEADNAPISEAQRQVEYAAQSEAIKDWGVANGMSYPVTEAAIKAVREAFSTQIRELKEASETRLAEMPSTKALALAQLKKAIPEMDPALFEKKCITLQPSSRYFPGPYSILDMYIDGRCLLGTPDSADNWGPAGRAVVAAITLGQVAIKPDGKPATWVSSSSEINVSDVLAKLHDLPRPLTTFKEQFPVFANAVKKTTSAQLKLLISALPREDRENLEFGKLTIRREIVYRFKDHPKRVTEGALLIETQRNGKVMTYEIDRLKGTITKHADKSYQEYPPTPRLSLHPGKRFDVIAPEGKHPAGLADEKKGAQGAFNSFSSARTQYIVDAMIADMDLPAVETYAKGATTFETEVPAHEILTEIALNLIPLRSAIKNFNAGNIGDGIIDLAVDIFGFIMALGPAIKGAKALAAGASVLSKALQVGKILGRAAVGALNPVSGLDDLGRGLLHAGRKAITAGYKGVKHLRGSYRSVNLLSLAKKPDIAEGTYKAANGASQRNVLAKYDEATDKWHAFDPRTQQMYGKALDDFAIAPPGSNDVNNLQAIAGKDTFWSRMTKAVEMLKGTSGNYDLLKAASKNHDAAAIGSIKLAGRATDSGAVFQNGKWYKYDPNTQRPYGPALSDFKPKVVAFEGEIKISLADSWYGKMIASIVAPAADNPNFRQEYLTTITKAENNSPAAYLKGLNNGKPEAIYGYSPTLKVDDLKRLAVAERRSAEELGSLARRISDLEILPRRLEVEVGSAKGGAQSAAYKKGYDKGNPAEYKKSDDGVAPTASTAGGDADKPVGITGFSDDLTLNQLAELATAPGRTPAELGHLVRYMEKRRIKVSLENYAVFNAEIAAAGGKATPLPQGFYLSQAALLSEGECAALSNVMATAVKQGKQEIFIKNLYNAMVPTLTPDEIAAMQKINPQKAALEQHRAIRVPKFRKQLDELQSVLGNKFHLDRASLQVPYTEIIAKLERANSSTTLLINGPGHGITAGVQVFPGKKQWFYFDPDLGKVTFDSEAKMSAALESTIKSGSAKNGITSGVEKTPDKKQWFYFDPNFGKATFDSQAKMSAALESTLRSGRTKNLLPHYGNNPALPEYKISVFDEVELNNTLRAQLSADSSDVSNLFRAEL